MAKKVCPKCGKKKPRREFHKNTSTRDGRACYCKVCRLRSASSKYKKWSRDNPEEAREKSRKASYKKDYGITIRDYNEMFLQQAGKCAICGTTKPTAKKSHFAVDHDHTTGNVRGLLCHHCNAGIGYLKDDIKLLANAIQYLTPLD